MPRPETATVNNGSRSAVKCGAPRRPEKREPPDGSSAARGQASGEAARREAELAEPGASEYD